MHNSPQFAVGDFRRAKDCQDQVDGLVAHAIDVMVTHGWESAEVLEAAELSLKQQWRSLGADPGPVDTSGDVEQKPFPDAPLSG